MTLPRVLRTGLIGALVVGVVLMGTRVDAADEYRSDIKFDDVELAQRVANSLKEGSYDQIPAVLDLLAPVVDHLNQQYTVDGDPRSLHETAKGAVDSGNEERIRAATITFLILNLSDNMRLAEEFVDSGKTDQAKVYVNSTQLLYDRTIKALVSNPRQVTDAIRSASGGIQRLNQNLDSAEKFTQYRRQVESSLANHFPELDLELTFESGG